MNFDWRHLTALILLVIFTAAGGLAYEASRPCSGALTAEPVRSVPSAVSVTPYSDFPENEHIRGVVREAATTDMRTSVQLSGSELRTVREQMAAADTFGGSWYVGYENVTVSVTDWCYSAN